MVLGDVWYRPSPSTTLTDRRKSVLNHTHSHLFMGFWHKVQLLHIGFDHFPRKNHPTELPAYSLGLLSFSIFRLPVDSL